MHFHQSHAADIAKSHPSEIVLYLLVLICCVRSRASVYRSIHALSKQTRPSNLDVACSFAIDGSKRVREML